MRNVFISKESFITDIAPKTDAVCFTSNPFTGKSYVLYESGFVVGINSETNQVDFECDLGFILHDMVEVEQHFFFISYLTEMERLLCITREGLIMTLDETEEMEPVGDIEGGILACCWTNDQEILLIVTAIGSLVLLNNSFEVLNEIHVDDLDTSAPVNISWRSDGEFVAINYKGNEKRCIKVFTKDLQFSAISHSMTEELASGIYPPVSWNPDHSLIATVQDEKRKTLIALYERNGLRHGECVLPSSMKNIQIAYNSTGSLIAVVGIMNEKPVLLIYTRMNYHWYMKLQRIYETPIQSIYWDLMNEMTLTVLFNDGSMNRLLFKWTVTNSYDYWNMNCVIDQSCIYLNCLSYSITPPPMYTTTITIPTEWNTGILSAFFASSSIHGNETPIPSLYLLTNTSLLICKPTQEKQQGTPSPRQFHSLITSYTISEKIDLPTNHYYSTGCYLNDDSLLVIYHDTQSSGLLVINPHTHSISSYSIPVCEIVRIDSSSILLEDSTNTLSILHIEDGEFLPSTLFTLSSYCEQLQVCHSPSLHTLSLSSSGRFYYDNQLLSNSIISFSLVFSYCTYIVNDVIPKLCFVPLSQLASFQSFTQPTTSIPINPNFSRSLERGSFLIGSGFDGRMVVQLPRGNLETFYPRLLSCNHIEQLMYEEEPDWKEIVELMRRQRIPLDLLYDINPAYFVSKITTFVNAQLNEDRINLFLSNMIDEDYTSEGHDYDGMFQVQEKPVGWIKRETICNAFLPVLKDKKYVEATVTCLCTYNPPRIEEALLYLQSIWNEDKKSLAILQQSNQEERKDDDDDDDEMIEEEENLGLKGMKWLLILIEPSIVYNSALGTYDLELTELVALLSQQDPREFKPYLEHLQELPVMFRKYEIDKQIKRWSKVLLDIATILQESLPSSISVTKEELFTEATNLMKERDLVKEYVEFFNMPEYSCQVHQAVGDYYSNKQQYDQALQHYLIVSPPPVQELLNTCLLLSKTDLYLTILFDNVKEDDKRKQSIQKLCSHLRNGKAEDIEKAATIYIEYEKDEEEAIVCLCSIQAYLRAIAISQQFDREDLIETVILPAIQAYYQSSLEQMKEKQEKLTRVVSRLQAIKEEKEKKIEREEEIKDNESVWSQSTNASAMTGITAISGMTSFFQDSAESRGNSLLSVTPVESLAELSKRADNTNVHAERSVKVMKFGKDVTMEKKEKKKKMRIRAGSPQEEEALKKMIELLTDVKELKKDIVEFIECLLAVHQVKEAQQLQREFHKHIDTIVEAKKTLGMIVDEKEIEEVSVYSWLEYSYDC